MIQVRNRGGWVQMHGEARSCAVRVETCIVMVVIREALRTTHGWCLKPRSDANRAVCETRSNGGRSEANTAALSVQRASSSVSGRGVRVVTGRGKGRLLSATLYQISHLGKLPASPATASRPDLLARNFDGNPGYHLTINS